MKANWFFEKFEVLADAPDAVPKMRRLVLELAFSGALSGTVRVAGLVPNGWVEKRVDQIAVSITPGFACSRSHQVEGGHIHLRTHNISTRGRLNFNLLVRIDPKMIDPQKASLSAGDVLFNNTNSQDLVGKSCLVDRDYDFGFSNHITRIQLCSDAFPGYVVFFLTHLRDSGYFSDICTRWINQAAVNTDALKRLLIPLPPVAEQKRIVAKVDELMALCDQLEAQQQERETRKSVLVRASLARFAEAPTSANLGFLFHKSYDIPPAELRRTILTIAVQGKLVESDPSEDPVDDLLVQMQKRRQQLIDANRIRKPRVLPPVTDDELPFSVPVGWRWTRWGQICDWITYGFTRPMAHVDKGPLIVTAKNVQDGFMSFEGAHRADAIEFAHLNPKDLPRKGDILITKDGTIGRAAVVETDEPFCINQSVAVLWLESCLMYRPFLLMVIRSPFAQGPIWEAAEGMAIKHLSITDFGKMILPLPPLAEQRRIVAKVDQIMALVDELERQQESSRTTASKLLEAIVHELTGAT